MEPMTDITRSPAAHDSSFLAVGTFVVHDDKPITAMQPKVQKALRKDIFTPLKLETMFNPPSPQETRVPTPEGSLDSSSSKRMGVTQERSVPFLFNGRDSSSAFPFTFSVQRSPRLDPVQHNCTDPQVDKSRLRLFHFHYDTFTREHLSALVDAIPISSSSLCASSASTHDVTNSPSSISHYRPAKRIKLSPPDCLHRARRRPRLSLPGNTPGGGRKDYVRESKSLVQLMTDAQSCSSPLAPTPPLAKKPLEREENVKAFGEGRALKAQKKLKDPKQGSYSSLSLRRQAAGLVAHDTRRNISPMSITDGISALSIDVNPLPQSLEQRSAAHSAGGVRITQVMPRDVPELLERVGSMIFNRQKMVWMKEDSNRNEDTGETSDDPFRNFESLVDGDSDRLVGFKRPLEADGEALPHLDSEEESTLSAAQEHDVREKHNTGENDTDLNADDESEPDGEATQHLPERRSSAAPQPEKDWTVSLIENVRADDQPIHSTLSSNSAKGPPPTPLRSVLKPGTPASSESTPHPSVFNRKATVAPRRSVSFSDGRTSGRIRGLHNSQTDESQSSQSLQPLPGVSMPVQVQETTMNDPSDLLEPSARADRIAEMLECLEDNSVGMCSLLSQAKNRV